MYRGFVTFGSNHLSNFRGNPMSVMLEVEGEDFNEARKNLMNNKDLGIGMSFAFQYDIEKAQGMTHQFGMKLYTQEELLKELNHV